MTVPKAEKLASLAYQQFGNLPKTGKPNDNEWTILSAILLHKSTEGETEVVAIGCGTKCIGKSKLCKNGFILNDSHAEVLARRAFLRYIYKHLKTAAASDDKEKSIFIWDPETALFSLRPDLSFHFLSTHTPCGDACIVRDTNGQQTEADCDEPAVAKRRKIEADESDDDVGHLLDTTAIYTGAKLIGLEDAQQDAMQQNVGAMRTKPGRGDRTLSMSCSDKLARWNVLGVQGALLYALLAEPIYFETLNFCGSAHNEDAIRSAVYGRFCDREFVSTRFKAHKPEIRIATDVPFEYAQIGKRVKPSATGLVWCNIEQNLRPYEVTVNGKRLGVTKNIFHTPHAALHVSKYHLLAEFVELLRLKLEILNKYNIYLDKVKHLKYFHCKYLAQEYQEAWALAKQIYFQQWTQKPTDLLEFTIDAGEQLSYNYADSFKKLSNRRLRM